MRDDSPLPPSAARSWVLVRCFARDFIRRHAQRIAFAFICMAIGAGSTALRAWLMQPVLDRVFIARDPSLLLLAGARSPSLSSRPARITPRR
jgi:ATP-binding cassette, subfamily B, bacterial MsbA